MLNRTNLLDCADMKLLFSSCLKESSKKPEHPWSFLLRYCI